MRTIAVVNQKGGCGKTTTAISLAASLAELGRRVLLVDMDPQGHASLGLSIRGDDVRRTVYDVLINIGSVEGPSLNDVTLTINQGLSLAPANITLSAVEQQLAGVDGREDRLRHALAEVRTRYDYCLIDSPPSVGLLTFNALRAADEVLVPVETGFFSMHGLAKLVETVGLVNSEYAQDVNLRIVPTLYDYRHRIDREVLTEIRRHFSERVLQTVIRMNVRLREAASFGLPITEFDSKSLGARDYMALAMEYVQLEEADLPILHLSTAGDHGREALEAPPAVAASLVASPAEAEMPSPAVAEAPDASAPAADSPEPATRVAETIVAQAETDTTDGAEPEQWSVVHPEVAGPGGVILRLHAPGAQVVQVAGDFNNWTPEVCHPEDVAEGVWKRALPLAKGRYRYRFVVDNNWCQDPDNPDVEECPYGGFNSVLTVA